MKCENYERVLLLETEHLPLDDARALELHASTCDDCTEALSAIREARRAARGHHVAPTAASRAKAWAAIEEKRRPSAFAMWRGPLLATAATIAAVTYFMRPPAEETGDAPQPEATVARAEPPERLPIAGGSIVPAKGARLAIQKSEADLTEILLTEGDIVVELEEGRAVDVVTADARVKVIGGRALIGATKIEVERGVANVWARSSPVPKAIRAGERLSLAPDVNATLDEAKAALPVDAPRAAVLAERVLHVVPKTTQLEAEALVVLADAERRRGRLQESADLYARVAIHPQGRSFAEESLLQRALILARISTHDVVLAELDVAAARFPNGATAPERAALAAEMWLAKNEPLKAADAIERAAGLGRSLKLLQRRVEVARALIDAHRGRAETLLAPVLDRAAPAALRADAEALMKK